MYRHLKNGDVLLMNRQPTLHKPSIMAHKVPEYCICMHMLCEDRLLIIVRINMLGGSCSRYNIITVIY